MKSLLLIPSILFGFSAHTQNLFCELADNPSQSEMMIEYVQNEPMGIFLRSPSETDFRKQVVNIEIIQSRRTDIKTIESFVTTPVIPDDLPWDRLPECFVEIGTMWHFEFDHSKETYRVFFVPYFAKKEKSCIPPRFSPQAHRLSCREVF